MSKTAAYKLEVVAPIFPVTDLKRAVEYYRDALLFDVGFEWADAPDDSIRYAILQSGNTELHLTTASEAKTVVAYFFVDNVAGYYDAIRNTAANIVQDIQDYPWEMREFEVVDPDGNRIIFGEHLSRIED